MDNRNASILWTGGKDCALAMQEARSQGYVICSLATFAPPDAHFLAHPVPFMKRQAESLGLPHLLLPVTPPFEIGYEIGLKRLREEMEIHTVITGDIAEVAGNPNWIRERCRDIGMNVETPLWGRDRNTLLRQLIDQGFKIHFSCVKTQWLDPSWVGREIDESAIVELQTVRAKNGLDLCGEEGEYHTLVLDGPGFQYALEIPSFSIKITDSMAFMEFPPSPSDHFQLP